MVTVHDLRDMEVEFFSYRSASVGECFLKLPRELTRELEDALAKKAGVHIDNHTVYGVTYTGGFDEVKPVTYIKFSDSTTTFGRTIDKRGY